MFHSRALASLLATVSLLTASLAYGSIAGIGIQPIPDQDIPSGKTLVIPIPATDPGGPARTYTVTVGAPTTGGTATTVAGITAAIRTGDPHFILGVSYTDSNSVLQTGTMEFQLLREFAPLTTRIIGGLAQGGFYSPTSGTSGTNYLQFFRVDLSPNFIIQGGDPNNNGSGGPGFSFPNEFSNALVFSGTSGQLAMANSGNGASSGNNGTNGSQFFVTLASDRAFDYGYNIFGQMLRGFDTLTGIAGTATQDNGSGENSSPINPVDITSAAVSQNDTDAVLLLSATGVCDAVVTVTASVSGSATATGTFGAHAIADTVSDPPFLQPVPDVTAPNGFLNLSLAGTDLQLDLLRYGFQTILPVAGTAPPFAMSGTSPRVSIPLISNTDNLVSATLDHWVSTSPHGSDARVFHVGAGEKPLRGSLSPIPAGRNGGLTLSSTGALAVFTSGNSKDTAPSFTASVNWGDGTFVSGSNLKIVKDPGAANRFALIAGHAYKAVGEFPVMVEIADRGGSRLALSATANISGSSIAISGTDILNTGGALKNQIVATFSDTDSSATASAYVATIDWGDGSVSPGTVKSAHGAYQILGNHVYKTADSFTLSAFVSRTGSAGPSASEWSTARIAGIAAPQVFPPFPQAHLAQIWSAIYADSPPIVPADNANGSNPFAGLVIGADGNLYGTTTQSTINLGSSGGAGTVYQITSSGSLTTLHSFTGGAGSDGGFPYAGLLSATDGNLYGTTVTGGADNGGTVFRISTTGSFASLYSFTGNTDGAYPYGGLVQASDGNLYGTTENYGAHSVGTVFRITTSGSLTTLHTFSAVSSGTNADGANPFATLITGTDGNLYGTTLNGANGSGTIFELNTSGSFNTLYSFSALNAGTNSDGANPYSGLLVGPDGNFYGTTGSGGPLGFGTVFQFTTGGALNTLYTFSGSIDGGNPYGGLVTGTDGNLYGTTLNGGANGEGTVFQITTGGALTTIYSFSALTSGSNYDGANPYAGLITGTDGNLYGTTKAGGSGLYPGGTVYQVTTTGTLTTLHSFTSDSLQKALRGSVAIVNSGNRPSVSGSFSVYVDANAMLDGLQTAFTSDGQTSFPIPPLQPGQNYILSFRLEGSVVDSRLKLPIGFDPTGQAIIGVVTYSDPVGDFDGSEKIVSPGHF